MKNEWRVVGSGENDDGGWKVVSAEVPKGTPSVSPRKRSAAERFADNFEEGRRGSLAGAAADALAANLPGQTGAYQRGKNKDEADAYDLRSEADPWYEADGGIVGKAAAGLATIGGVVAGGLPSPEGWIGPGKTALGRIAANAGINAAVDVPVQGLQNEAGTHEGFDAWRVVGAAATGGLVQGGFEVGGAVGKAVAPVARNAARKVGEVVDNLAPKPARNDWVAVDPPVSPAPASAAKPSVDDVWPNLIRQESGDRQFGKDGQLIRSSAGAGGVAQLMPGTAREVARKLGDPSLADLAFQPTEAGRAANERLGRAYYAEQLEAFDGDHQLAAAAYNAGPGRVRRALKKWGRADVLAHLPAETQHYVKVVVGDGAPKGTGRSPDDLTLVRDEFGGFSEPERAAPDVREEAPSAPEPEDIIPPETVDFFGNDNPIPTTPTERVPPEPNQEPADPLTERALDAIRRGERVTENRGPTLLEWVQQHGLRDDAGELAALGINEWHRAKPFRRKIVRDDGRALDDLAVAAQEQGFLPERFGEGDTRATPQDLIDAMREELAGRPHYSREDMDGAALKARVDDLDEMLNHLGIDPKTKTDAEINQAINAYWSGRDEPSAFGDAAPDRAAALPDRLGLNGPSPRPRADIQPEAFGPMGDRLQSTGATLNHQRVPQPIPAAQGGAYSGRPVRELMHDLRVALDLTHRRGRLRGRKSLGEYDTRSGVIRSKHADDIDVLVHEAGHKLEFTDELPNLEAAMTKHAKSLEPLDYDPMQKRRHEGFAEFLRHYVTNPYVARRLAPDFYTDFEAAMAIDNPKALAAMQAISREWDGYLKAGSLEIGKADLAMTGDKGGLAKVKQTLKDEGVAGALNGVFDRAYTWFVDDLHPLQKAEKKLGKVYEHHKGKPLELKGAESPYVLARLSRDAYQAGRVDALHGVVPYKGIDPEGPSLGDAITKVFGDKWTDDSLNGFDVYLASRRMVHEWDRFSKGELTRAPDKFSKAVHEQRITDFEAQFPNAKEGSALVYEWIANLWKKEFEAGFLTEAQYKAGLEKPDYVPLMRDMSDTRGAGGKIKGDGKNAGGMKRFGGSRRAIVSPITSMMKRAYELNINIKRNEVIRTLDGLAEKAGPGAGAVIERLPEKEIEAYNTDALAALEKAMKENDLLSPIDATTILAAADAALDGDGKVQMFRRRATEAKPGELVVWHWKDGRKIPLMLADGEFGRELYTAIAGMDRQMQNGLVDFMSAFTQALRTGITLSPEFVGANIVRDQIATWINTDVGFKPGLSYVSGAKEQLADGAISKRYQAIGGMKGGLNTSALTKPNPATDGLARRQRKDLNKANYRARTYRLNQNPLHLAAALTDISEAGSRLGVFKLAFNKAKKAGLSDYEAAVEAGITSRDYMDFGRHGSKMLTAVRLVTFLNAAVQSLDKAGRVLNASGYDRPNMAGLRRVLAPLGKGAPKTAAEKAAVAHAYKAMFRIGIITTFGAGLAAIYADDKEFQELTSYERATAWWFRANGTWWRIPKPFELAVPSNIAERMIEGRITGDPTIGQSIIADLGHTVVPPHAAPAVNVPVEIMRNRDSFGRPIVPDHKRGSLDPDLQYNAYTSKLSKRIGAALNVAPAVLDHVVTGFLGSMGRYALQGSDLAVEAATGAPRMAVGPEDAFFVRRFSGDPMRGSRSQERFWELVGQDGGEFTRAEGTFRAHMREGTAEGDARAVEYLNGLKPEARAYVMAKVFSEKGSSRLHPMVRAQESAMVLSDLRHEIREGTLTELNGDPIDLTPEQRRRADAALTAMSAAEMRNGLIATGEKGWAQKELLSRRDPKAELKELGLLRVVEGRQQLAKVPPAGAVLRLWGSQRATFEAPASPEALGRLMADKRLQSSDTETKRRELVRQTRK